MKYPTEYETERLIIRATNVQDNEFIYEILNTEDWLKFIGDRKVYSPEDAVHYIESKMLTQLERIGFTNNTVIRKSDNKKIGTVGLYDREGLEGIDIGFAFLPEYYGKGYGYESASKVMDLAINLYKLTTINAITMKTNIPSQKLIKKLGLQYVKDVQLPNDPETLQFYQRIIHQ